jgi:tetratricopeptide (TPR) repeat protein
MSDAPSKTAPAGEWTLITMDAKRARRQGVPERMPVPSKELEALATKGLSLDQIRTWTRAFLSSSPLARNTAWRAENKAIVTRLEAFVSKAELWAKAQQSFAANDFKRAISTLTMIAAVDPDDHAAKMNLASALANTGDHSGALKHFEAVRETFTGEVDYHLALGQLHVARGDRDQATDELALALQANPECKPAMDALMKLGVLVAVYEDPRDADSLVYIRADGVLEVLTKAWDAAPRDGAYWLEQLAYHEAERRAEVALAAADRALAAGGDVSFLKRARTGRIAALLALGRQETARAEVEAELARSPEAAWAHVEQARFLVDDGKEELARAALDRALAIDAGDPQALTLRFFPRDPEDIAQMNAHLPALVAFAETHADFAGAWRALARAKAIVGAEDEAATLFASATALAPGDDELRAEAWAHLVRLRRFDELLREAGAVTDLSTRDWKLRWCEAEAYGALGKLMEARAGFAGINKDASLQVEVRKRAKRAAVAIEERAGAK